jgi:dTDP-glucose 4,6-dehydratase
VVCPDNFCTGTTANVEDLIGNPAFRLIRYGVSEHIHAGGPVAAVMQFASPIDYLELPIETLRVGSLGTMHALGLARHKGARFLIASTSEVYGDRWSTGRARTTGATSTRSPSARSMTRPSGSPRR